MIVFALVEPCKGCPKGRGPLVGCYSDETDEDYIIETIYKRLGLQKDQDGKVDLTYEFGGKSSTTVCSVRPDEEGLADIVFTKRRPRNEELAKVQKTIGMLIRPISSGACLLPFCWWSCHFSEA